MAERVPWWRAFMGGSKRRSVSKENTTTTQTLDTESTAASQLPTDQPQQKQPPLQQTAKPQPPVSEGTSLFTEEFVDDSQFESVFNEQTCRRNLRVSRSGRFKERKKVRSSLPTDDQDQVGTPRTEDTR